MPKIKHPMLVWQSVLAGAQVLTAASDLTNLVGGRVAGALVLLVGAAQVGTAAYLHGGAATTADTPASTAATQQ